MVSGDEDDNNNNECEAASETRARLRALFVAVVMVNAALGVAYGMRTSSLCEREVLALIRELFALKSLQRIYTCTMCSEE